MNDSNQQHHQHNPTRVREEDSETLDPNELRVVDTERVLTVDELATLKEIIARYKAAKWVVIAGLSLGAMAVPVIDWVYNHLSFK